MEWLLEASSSSRLHSWTEGNVTTLTGDMSRAAGEQEHDLPGVQVVCSRIMIAKTEQHGGSVLSNASLQSQPPARAAQGTEASSLEHGEILCGRMAGAVQRQRRTPNPAVYRCSHWSRSAWAGCWGPESAIDEEAFAGPSAPSKEWLPHLGSAATLPQGVKRPWRRRRADLTHFGPGPRSRAVRSSRHDHHRDRYAGPASCSAHSSFPPGVYGRRRQVGDGQRGLDAHNN
jgi:hypothetical protein